MKSIIVLLVCVALAVSAEKHARHHRESGKDEFKVNEHGSITRAGLALLPTNMRFNTEATRWVVNANQQTDDKTGCIRNAPACWHLDNKYGAFHAKFHFDDEGFGASSAHVMNMSNLIKSELTGPDRETDNGLLGTKLKNADRARLYLGHALHVIQDFYAHSNWVEICRKQGTLQIHPDLGVRTFQKPAHTGAVCANDKLTLTPYGLTVLTSGYFSVTSPCTAQPGKCVHGTVGIPVMSTAFPCDGISKDAADRKGADPAKRTTFSPSSIVKFAQRMAAGTSYAYDSTLTAGQDAQILAAINTKAFIVSVFTGIPQNKIDAVRNK